ncbi:hypothetical protein Tco_1017297 [Tanacetum coccineum]|uniref:Uncharacterized protein n=1 Tax=Tanacetum coccineum TaxID=301880 RepID=A0ABQ5FT29_9ASTR
MKPFAQLVGKTMQVVISYACSSSYYLPNGLLNLTTRLSIGLVVSFEAVNTTPLDEVIGDASRSVPHEAGADLIAGSFKMGKHKLAHLFQVSGLTVGQLLGLAVDKADSTTSLPTAYGLNTTSPSCFS